ncbi:hypothetical protein [Paucibacter sp. XJ19-41]|uniref:hypothetical protein n=1 Tax=Paucibacter sp. XJ19-41 TaxID=2927824 RepID=UPI00234A6D65|nr:hypothetical protein [Paucibacter sp. XJ19-41]MDC6169648.1 hypothetical protein [Paucibacter sp. XJ19-41]
MKELLCWPDDMATIEWPTVVLIKGSFEGVLTYLADSFRRECETGQTVLKEFPCSTALDEIHRYQGEPDLNVLAPSLGNDGETLLWTSDAGDQNVLLTRLSWRLNMASVGMRKCSDWSSPNAASALMVMGTQGKNERFVRVMRDESGRLDFYCSGPVQAFESEEHYRNRFKKERMNSKVVDEYWRKLGVDLERETSEWTGRPGIVFFRRRRSLWA